MWREKYIPFGLFKHSTRALNDPIKLQNSTRTQEWNLWNVHAHAHTHIPIVPHTRTKTQTETRLRHRMCHFGMRQENGLRGEDSGRREGEESEKRKGSRWPHTVSERVLIVNFSCTEFQFTLEMSTKNKNISKQKRNNLVTKVRKLKCYIPCLATKNKNLILGIDKNSKLK